MNYSQSHISSADPPAGLLRRLGALVSDSLVVVGLLLLGSLPFVPLLQFLHARAMVPSEVGWAWSGLYWTWLLAIWMGFMGFFWTRSGQTVGMKAWHIRVQGESGRLLSWSQSLRRLGYASLPWMPGLVMLALADRYHFVALKIAGEGLLLLGVLGLACMYVDPRKRTWHDRISQSRVIKLPKL